MTLARSLAAFALFASLQAPDTSPGRVVGSALDATGIPLHGAVTFRAVHEPAEGSPEALDPDAWWRPLPVESEGATFVLEDVPPGRVWLFADTTFWGTCGVAEVEVVPGEAVRADVVFPFDPERAALVTVEHEATHHVGYGTNEVELRSEGRVRAGRRLATGHCTFVFEDLDPGEWELVVDVAGGLRQTWPVELGERHEVRLSAEEDRSCRLSVELVDALTGAAIEDYALTLERRGRSLALRAPGDPPPPGGVFDGDLSGRWTAELSAPGYSTERVVFAVPELGFSLVARLDPFRTLEGRVVDVDGRPAADVAVTLSAVGGSAWSSARLREVRFPERHVRTDAEGRFVFEELRRGTYLIEAEEPLRRYAVRRVVAVRGERTEAPTLALPGFARARGRLLGEPPPGAYVEADMLDTVDDPRKAQLRPDGVFVFAGLPAGRVRLSLVAPDGPLLVKRSLEIVELAPGENDVELALD